MRGFVHVILAVLIGAVCLICLAVRTLWPGAVLPGWDVPMLAALSLLALALEGRRRPKGRSWFLSALGAGASFGLIPWCAGLTGAPWALFLAGGAVFGGADFLYASVLRRLPEHARLGPAAGAFLLFLAGMALAGPPLG
ncbi:MAG: hypothetical protein PUC36_08885 [Clostridiales bacterium]|nr:hypothetical protein [Clostridiales bacterium]